MKWTQGLFYILVKQALQQSNTSQETLAIACDIPLPKLKAFLTGSELLGRYEWERVKGALGITLPRKGSEVRPK